MKRTAEMVLSIIGTVFYILAAGAMMFLTFIFTNEQIVSEIEKELTTAEEFDVLYMLNDFLSDNGIVFTVFLFVCAILGIVAAVFFKKNMSPKLMGIILIVLAVLCAVITIGWGIIPGVFFLAAGLVAVFRRVPQPVQEPNNVYTE